MLKNYNPIIKYEVINPVASNKKPYYDARKDLFIFPVTTKYTRYVESAIYGSTGGREYYILLGTCQFSEHCRICHVDGYGKCKIRVRGELKDYIISETKYRGNINVEYVESTDSYDVFIIV
jgi:hypothetical protein